MRRRKRSGGDASQARHDRWTHGPWTTRRALERCRVLSDVFDKCQLTGAESTPIEFLSVPWPVLHKPMVLRAEDADWSAVEVFFRAMRQRLPHSLPPSTQHEQLLTSVRPPLVYQATPRND